MKKSILLSGIILITGLIIFSLGSGLEAKNVREFSKTKSTIFSEDFDGAFPPTNWTVNYSEGGFSWVHRNVSGSNYCVEADCDSISGTWPDSVWARLATPDLDFTGVNASVLRFKYSWGCNWGNNSYFRIVIRHRVADVSLFDISGTELKTGDNATPTSPGSFQEYTVALPDTFMGTSGSYIEFEVANGKDNDCDGYIDDIEVIGGYRGTAVPVANSYASIYADTTLLGRIMFSGQGTLPSWFGIKAFPGVNPYKGVVNSIHRYISIITSDDGNNWMTDSLQLFFDLSEVSDASNLEQYKLYYWDGADWTRIADHADDAEITATAISLRWAFQTRKGYYHYKGGDGTLDFAVSKDPPATLPVELSSFNGSYQSNSGSVMLNWTTQTETDNLRWNIYRGENNNFNEADKITMILGNGTTSQPSKYSYEDKYVIFEAGNTYWYWLESIDYGGMTYHYGPVSITIPEQVEDPYTPPARYTTRNYPNPFNPTTTFEFFIQGEEGEKVPVKLSIYNIKGELMETVMDEPMEVGKHRITWRSNENYGSGVYFYKIETPNFNQTKKMIILK